MDHSLDALSYSLAAARETPLGRKVESLMNDARCDVAENRRWRMLRQRAIQQAIGYDPFFLKWMK